MTSTNSNISLYINKNENVIIGAYLLPVSMFSLTRHSYVNYVPETKELIFIKTCKCMVIVVCMMADNNFKHENVFCM